MRPQSDDRRHGDPGNPDNDEAFVDPTDLDNPVTPKLPPFQLRLKVNDASAALKKEDGSFLGELLYLFVPESDSLDSVASGIVNDLPPALEQAGVKCILAKDGTDGETIRLMMEITGYELSAFLPNQTSQEMESALSALPPLVAPLGAQKQYDAVHQKVKEFFEIKWMHKIPKILNKHLLKMGVDADTSVEPPPPSLPKPDKLPAPDGLKLFLRVELPSRLDMGKAADSSLTEEGIKNMSQANFLRLIRPKLEEHVARAIRVACRDCTGYVTVLSSFSGRKYMESTA
ncbi:unnamed protein product [Symbiodinium natans]|uniref:Uncharacterized protein n=1 Tax=Symbiodinium natans TaxID=878477 RepID=A0A812TGR7_9DINO|nr:unnamed protein product [Symbiodinium natans]